MPQLQTALAELGMKKFRAKQIYDWLYQKCVFDFAQMSNLGKAERQLLQETFSVLPAEIRVVRKLDSVDGLTQKILLELPDGNAIETVLMHHDYGYSVCVSSQVGCDMHCAFCASGLHGAVRNLTVAEIAAQVYLFDARLAAAGERVSRVVVMGSGEPMLNFDAVFGYRNMTVSTCGIIPGIQKMQKLELPINLAISLHAVRNELRSELMPVNQGFPFPDVIAAAEEYAVSSGRQVTYEYILLADINDSDRDAELLAEYLRYKQAGVNLIPANPVPEKGYFRPKMQRIINAACGQLRAAFAGEKAQGTRS